MGIVQTIADQIGRQAFAMIGARDLVALDASTLKFRIGRNAKSVNAVTITLDPSDTYTVKFWRVRGIDWRAVAEHSFVYAESLRGIIAEETGMAVSL